MILTNNTDLHPFVPRAAQAQMHAHPTRESEGAFASVTTLQKPPTAVALTERHWAELTEDVVDRLWALQGSAFHHVLETGSGEDRAEERMSFYIDGEKITGGFDAVVKDDWLADFKYTSVWSAIYKDRLQEWIAQVNMYVYGLEANGTHITRATVEAFFRDWSQTEADRRSD